MNEGERCSHTLIAWTDRAAPKSKRTKESDHHMEKTKRGVGRKKGRKPPTAASRQQVARR